ncbi:MAG: hydrolase family protein [Pseudonocardiales bacterium]|nr:hydrolase family protein [Pseudonocardiales bacterium]
MQQPFDYDNLTGRPSGPFVTAAARLIPGVGFVQKQVRPYAAAWRAANVSALAEPGPHWFVLGDSMSQGVGASRFDAGWVNQVHDRLALDGIDYTIVNLSASGARVSDVIDTQLPVLENLRRADRDDVDRVPDLVTLMIGANDVIRKQHRLGLPERYAELLRRLPVGTVVATLPNPRQVAVEVNKLILRAGSARGLIVAEMRSGRTSSWRGKLAQDHFHPNDAGYAGLGETFYEAITSARATAAGAAHTL